MADAPPELPLETIQNLNNLKCCKSYIICNMHKIMEYRPNINCWNFYIDKHNDPELKLYIGYVYINISKKFEYYCCFCNNKNII